MNTPALVRSEAPSIVLEVAQSTPEGPAPARWRLANRILFRFAFTYFILYHFPFPLGFIPGTKGVANALQRPWTNLVLWVGKRILPLGHEISAVSNGSGDKTFDYVQLLCIVLLAIAATLIWSIVDRRRTQYTRLFAWLRLYLRYVLVYWMLSYGMSKVFKLQFTFPAPM